MNRENEKKLRKYLCIIHAFKPTSTARCEQFRDARNANTKRHI